MVSKNSAQDNTQIVVIAIESGDHDVMVSYSYHMSNCKGDRHELEETDSKWMYGRHTE